jgi:hypothetical protein
MQTGTLSRCYIFAPLFYSTELGKCRWITVHTCESDWRLVDAEGSKVASCSRSHLRRARWASCRRESCWLPETDWEGSCLDEVDAAYSHKSDVNY